MELKLTNTDMNAVTCGDSNYINAKGANYYNGGNYALAVEYYRLAAAMGNLNAVSNLGYCYLYGRSIEANLSLALAYFKLAAFREDIDACYKLGDIYGSDKWGVKDKEMSVYYYRMAASFIFDEDFREADILQNETLIRYPSLAFAMGRETGLGGSLMTDLDVSFRFLKVAEIGYETDLANGSSFYQEAYQSVLEWLEKEEYQKIKEKYKFIYEDNNDDELIQS